MDAQSRSARRQMGGQSASGALVQGDRRTAGSEGGARQSRGDQIEPGHRERRPEGPLLQPRPLRQGVELPSVPICIPPRDSGGTALLLLLPACRERENSFSRGEVAPAAREEKNRI